MDTRSNLQNDGRSRTHLIAVLALAALWGFSVPAMAEGSDMASGLTDLNGAPIQMTMVQPVNVTKNGYTLKEVAHYAVTARIVSMHRYHAGRETDVSPVDLALGWGELADENVLHKMSFRQDRRRVFLQSSSAEMTQDQIAARTANTHIIPANAEVEEKIASLRGDEVVTLRGKLVDVTHPDGWHWDTSLTRDDMGDGACEIMYVDAVVVN